MSTIFGFLILSTLRCNGDVEMDLAVSQRQQAALTLRDHPPKSDALEKIRKAFSRASQIEEELVKVASDLMKEKNEGSSDSSAILSAGQDGLLKMSKVLRSACSSQNGIWIQSSSKDGKFSWPLEKMETISVRPMLSQAFQDLEQIDDHMDISYYYYYSNGDDIYLFPRRWSPDVGSFFSGISIECAHRVTNLQVLAGRFLSEMNSWTSAAMFRLSMEYNFQAIECYQQARRNWKILHRAVLYSQRTADSEKINTIIPDVRPYLPSVRSQVLSTNINNVVLMGYADLRFNTYHPDLLDNYIYSDLEGDPAARKEKKDEAHEQIDLLIRDVIHGPYFVQRTSQKIRNGTKRINGTPSIPIAGTSSNYGSFFSVPQIIHFTMKDRESFVRTLEKNYIWAVVLSSWLRYFPPSADSDPIFVPRALQDLKFERRSDSPDSSSRPDVKTLVTIDSFSLLAELSRYRNYTDVGGHGVLTPRKDESISHPEARFKYMFHSDEDIDKCMERNFPDFYQHYKDNMTDFWWDSNRYVPIEISDLGRCCILYEHGGIYADTDVQVFDGEFFWHDIQRAALSVATSRGDMTRTGRVTSGDNDDELQKLFNESDHHTSINSFMAGVPHHPFWRAFFRRVFKGDHLLRFSSSRNSDIEGDFSKTEDPDLAMKMQGSQRMKRQLLWSAAFGTGPPSLSIMVEDYKKWVLSTNHKHYGRMKRDLNYTYELAKSGIMPYSGMTTFRHGMVRDGGSLSILLSPTSDPEQEFTENSNEFDARVLRKFHAHAPFTVSRVKKLQDEYLQNHTSEGKHGTNSLEEYILGRAPPVLFQSLSEQAYGAWLCGETLEKVLGTHPNQVSDPHTSRWHWTKSVAVHYFAGSWKIDQDEYKERAQYASDGKDGLEVRLADKLNPCHTHGQEVLMGFRNYECNPEFYQRTAEEGHPADDSNLQLRLATNFGNWTISRMSRADQTFCGLMNLWHPDFASRVLRSETFQMNWREAHETGFDSTRASNVEL